MGKNPGASEEELEFIFKCLADNLPDRTVLEELESESFPKRGIRFIADRRREFNAAKRVLRAKLEKEIDPIVVQSKQKHYEELTELAHALLEDGLDNMEQDRDKLTLIEDHGQREITESELNAILIANKDIAIRKYTTNRMENLVTHLVAENEEMGIRGFDNYLAENPIDLIELLSLLCQKRTFKGKCRVCDEW